VSVSVARLVDSLKSAKTSLEQGLLWWKNTASSASAALNDALRSLREGVQAIAGAGLQAIQLAEAAVEGLPGAGWLPAPGRRTTQSLPRCEQSWLHCVRKPRHGSLAARRLCSTRTGLSSVTQTCLTLTACCRARRSTIPGAGRQALSRAAAAQTAATREVASREERTKQATADALFQLCLACSRLSAAPWQWRLDVMRQLLVGRLFSRDGGHG
jgi:hypothetical protein